MSIPSPGAHSICPGSVLSDWATIHDSLAAMAATGTVLKIVLTVADSNVHIARVPAGCTRVRLRARYAIAVTALSTQPVIQAYVIYDPSVVMAIPLGIPTLVNDGSVRVERIDAITFAAAGTTAQCTPATDLLDAAFGYGDPCVNAITTGTSFDLNGGAWFFALVKTAAVVSGGAGAVNLQAQFLN